MADGPDDQVIDVGGASPLPPGAPVYSGPGGSQAGNPNVPGTTVAPAQKADANSFVPEPPPKVAATAFQPEVDNTSTGAIKAKILAEAKAQGYTDQQAQYALGLATHESSLDPKAMGTPDPSTGHQATGLFQMFPAAAQDAGVANPKDLVNNPDLQIKAGLTYLKQKIDKYDGDLDMAGMAYNAGDNPANWQPAYTVANRAAAGMPVPQNFHNFAGQLFQQQHAATDPANTQGQGWNYGRNTLNNLTLGALTPVQSMVDAEQNGTSYDQEQTLQRAWQAQWLRDHPMASMASDVQGFAVPDTLAAKGVMAGGRALADAAPLAAKILTPILGLSDGYQPIKAGITAIPRAMAGGAGLGVLNSQSNPAQSVAKDAVMGAAGGAIAQPLASAAGYAGQLGGTVLRATGLTGQESIYNTIRQGLAKTLGTDPAPLVPSQVPGVQYSLPEMLGGKNPEINAKFADVAKTDPVQLQNQIAQNNAARMGFYHQTVGTQDDIATLNAARKGVNDNIQTVMNTVDKPGAGQKFGLHLGGAAAQANAIIKDTSKNKIPGMVDEMKEALRVMHEEVLKPKKKETASLEDILSHLHDDDFENEIEKGMQELHGENVTKQLVSDPRSIHGVWNYMRAAADAFDKPGNMKDSKIQKAILDVKDHVDKEFRKIPGIDQLLNQHGEISDRIKELEFLQGKKIANIQDIMNPTALHNMIEEIKNAPLYRGLLGQKAKAKSVLPETLDRLETLRKDIATSLAAKVPVNVSQKAVEADNEHPLGGLFHVSAGTLGAVAGRASMGPGGGPIGWATAMLGQKVMQKAASAAGGRTGRVALDIMLHPHKFPPIPPQAPSVPGGFYSGMLGGNALNGLLQGKNESTSQGVKHDNVNPTDSDYKSTAKAGAFSGGGDYPYTRSFDAGSFPQNSPFAKMAMQSPGLYSGLMKGVSQPTGDELPSNDDALITHMEGLAKATNRPVDSEKMQGIANEWNAAKRSPIARLGFNLGRTMILPKDYSYGDEAGLYTPDKDMMLAALDGPPGTLAHESIHRGLQILRKAGLTNYSDINSPDSSKDIGDYDEEGIVRMIMHDTMGDPQGKETPKEYKYYISANETPTDSWDHRGPDRYALINELNKRATKYILAQRAKGQRVDY